MQFIVRGTEIWVSENRMLALGKKVVYTGHDKSQHLKHMLINVNSQ